VVAALGGPAAASGTAPSRATESSIVNADSWVADRPARIERRRPRPTFSPGLRDLGTELGISQPELAAALGIAYQQLYKYEQAKNPISASRLYELSEALDVPVAFLRA
jgi:DNA-binding Xre family transcriptional regulator